MRLLAISLCCLLTGCALLPVASSQIPVATSHVQPGFSSAHGEAVGIIHLHTDRSDGRLPIKKIAQIANRQNLDFLVVTDHDTLEGRRQEEAGWYGKTLVLIETEISTQGGHVLGLGLKQEIPRLNSAQWTLDQIQEQGGFGFIAHPLYARRPWKDFSVEGVKGLEIYSAKEDIMDESVVQLGLWTLLAGSEVSLLRWLDRRGEALALWDQLLAQGRPWVGIGSADAHGLMRYGFRLGPYATLFKLVRNHLLIPGALDQEAIYEALRQGHLFVAHDWVADASGFRFLAIQSDQVRGVMGDQVALEPGLLLYSYLPAAGTLTLFQDGEPVSAWKGQEGHFWVEEPGVYRVEATFGARPWITSNPIYVVE